MLISGRVFWNLAETDQIAYTNETRFGFINWVDNVNYGG